MNDALLPLLPTLVALVDTQSVTRAARELGISQPRMSARLSDLRRLLGDPVLIPASSRRGSVATTRAIALADAARRILQQLDRAVSDTPFDPATATRTFSIMANDNAAVIIGLPLVTAIRQAGGPHIRTALYSYDVDRLDDLERGRIDLVIGSPGQLAAMPTLVARTVVRDSFMTVSGMTVSGMTASGVMASGVTASGVTMPGTLRTEGTIDLDHFCARDHVLVSGEGGGFDGVIDAALAELGRRRRVVASVQSYLVAVELAASSDLLATLPGALVSRATPRLALMQPPLALAPFTLSAAWHPRVAGDPAHRWLRDMLLTVSGPARTPPAPSGS